MKRFVILFCVIQAMLGCAAKGPAFHPARAPSGDEALIYIYRPASFTLSTRTALVHINDSPVVTLANNGYTAVYVKAGRYTVSQHYPALLGVFGAGEFEEPVKIAIDVQAGERKYVELLPRSTRSSEGGVSTVNFVWSLTERGEDEALTPLRNCKFQPPLAQR